MLNLKKDLYRDSPRGPVVKNRPSNAGDVGLISGRGSKISHVKGKLSPCDVTTEATCSGEKPMHHSEDTACHN